MGAFSLGLKTGRGPEASGRPWLRGTQAWGGREVGRSEGLAPQQASRGTGQHRPITSPCHHRVLAGTGNASTTRTDWRVEARRWPHKHRSSERIVKRTGQNKTVIVAGARRERAPDAVRGPRIAPFEDVAEMARRFCPPLPIRNKVFASRASCWCGRMSVPWN